MAAVPIEIRGEQTARRQEVLSDRSTALVAELELELGPRRADLLDRRHQLQEEFTRGRRPDFSGSTAQIRSAAWRVPPAPADLVDRRVEITGPTAVATEVFDGVLGERANQLEVLREDVAVDASRLLDVAVPDGSVTEAGLRNNVAVCLRYLESWLRGTGAVTVFNLMEDAATAEIARAQLWQWCRHRVALDDGRAISPELVRHIAAGELEALQDDLDKAGIIQGRAKEAAGLVDTLALSDGSTEFLTLAAYERLP